MSYHWGMSITMIWDLQGLGASHDTAVKLVELAEKSDLMKALLDMWSDMGGPTVEQLAGGLLHAVEAREEAIQAAIAAAVKRPRSSTSRKEGDMRFPKPETEEGYEIVVDGIHVWVDAPRPVRDDEATQRIVQRQHELGFEWGESCSKPEGRLRL